MATLASLSKKLRDAFDGVRDDSNELLKQTLSKARYEFNKPRVGDSGVIGRTLFNPTAQNVYQNTSYAAGKFAEGVPVFGKQVRGVSQKLADISGGTGPVTATKSATEFGRKAGAVAELIPATMTLGGLSKAPTILGKAGSVVKTGGTSAAIGGGLNKAFGGTFTEGAKEGYRAAPVIQGISLLTNPLLAKSTSRVASQFNNPLLQQLSGRVAAGGANVLQGIPMNKALNQPAITPLSAGIDFATGLVGGERTFDTNIAVGRKPSKVHPEDVGVLDQAMDMLQNKKAKLEGIESTEYGKQINLLADKYLKKDEIDKVVTKTKGKDMRKYYVELGKALQKKSREVEPDYGFADRMFGKLGIVDDNPLIQEVRKYKSADEFIDNLLFRGEPGKFKPIKIDKRSGVPRTLAGYYGYPTTTDFDYATRRFAKNWGDKPDNEVRAFLKKSDAKILSDKETILKFMDNGKEVTHYKNPNSGTISRTKTKFFSEPYKIKGGPNPDHDLLYLRAKKAGYDAVDLRNIEGMAQEHEVRILNPDKFIDVGQNLYGKTKSQLTDIWNKANQPINSPYSMGIVGNSPTKTTQSPELPKEVLQPQAKVPTVQTPVPQVAKQDVLQRGTEQTKQGLGLEPPKDTRAASLENIVRQSATPVKQKVSLVDYLRTPSHVLKKIGLEKQAEALKTAHNAYLDELPKEINKVTEWYKRAPSPESATNIFKHLDGQRVFLDPNETQVAKEIRNYLMNWADRLGLPKDSRITNYITHIFDEQLIQKEFDDDLAKIIQDNVAGSVYDPFTQQRLGALGYKENVWEALDAYVKRGVRKVNMDSALEQVKKAADNLEISQFNYVKRYVDRINMRPTEVDNLLDNTIKQMVGYRLGGRPTARISKTARQMVYRGTLGLNVGSALRNLTQAVNTYSELGEKYTVLGYTNLLKNGTKELDEVGIFRNSMVEDRALNATKKFWEKTDKVLFSFFELAERINRGSAYYGAKAKGLSKGMTEDQARKYATGIVEKTQFTFGKIDTPVAMQSDIVKLLTQFQSYNMKQLEFLGGKVKARDVAGLARYSIGSFVMLQTIGQLLGMDWKDLIPSIKIGASPVFTSTRDIIQSITGGEDDYGNELSPDDRAKMAGKAVLPFIPAGVQTRKTVGGILDLNRGYTQTKSGNVRTPLNATPSNWLRGVTFGSNTLPEVQEHWDNDTKALSEKQSQEFRTTSDRKGYYESVLQGREDNKENQAARERVAQTGKEELSNGRLFYMGNETDSKTGEVKKVVKSLDVGDIEQTNAETGLGKYIITTETGNKAVVDLTKPLEKPEATGQKELDKELISRYNSSITTRINNIEKVYLDGQMTAGEAEKAISDLKAQKITTGKAKKKGVKVSLPKITLSTSPISKSKIRPVGTIKLKKAPKLKLKAAKPTSIKLAKKNYSKGKPIKFRNTLSDSLTKLV